MGWHCVIRADKDISAVDVQSVINNLPSEYQRFGVQSWGWSLLCDVSFPRGNVMTIGGSHSITPRAIAKPFVQLIVNGLREKGYVIKRRWYP